MHLPMLAFSMEVNSYINRVKETAKVYKTKTVKQPFTKHILISHYEFFSIVCKLGCHGITQFYTAGLCKNGIRASLKRSSKHTREKNLLHHQSDFRLFSAHRTNSKKNERAQMISSYAFQCIHFFSFREPIFYS